MAKAYFGNGTPFSRALDYNRRLGAMIRGGKPLQEAIAKLGVYESRGHGRAKNSGLTVAKAHRATHLNLRGKQYEGIIQGKQEIARRLRTAPKQNARRTWAITLDTLWGYAVGVRSSSRAGVTRIANKLLATGIYRCEQSAPVLGVPHG